MRLLFCSTPVSRLGSGLGGGVELTLLNVTQELRRRGHGIDVVAPAGSLLGSVPVVEIPGRLQPNAQDRERGAPVVVPGESVLANMWEHARRAQADYDLIVNFAYDWLPYYLTPFFGVPIAHFVSMSSLGEATDRIMAEVAERFPGTIGVNTATQARTFPFAEHCRCLGKGIDLSLYQFCKEPGPHLAWVGRIAPEKALEDAVAAAQATGIPLKIMGRIQDEDYWRRIRKEYGEAEFQYAGFLSTERLQEELGRCRALLLTSRWVEAFGIVAIEALACGVPVLAYRRGGPAEIVRDGRTGWLVEPDSVAGLIDAVGRLDELDRAACRRQAEEEFSLRGLGDRFEAWFEEILVGSRRHDD